MPTEINGSNLSETLSFVADQITNSIRAPRVQAIRDPLYMGFWLFVCFFDMRAISIF